MLDSLDIKTIEDSEEIENEEIEDFDLDLEFEALDFPSHSFSTDNFVQKLMANEKRQERIESLDDKINSKRKEKNLENLLLPTEQDETEKKLLVERDDMEDHKDVVTDKRIAAFFDEAPVEESLDTFTSMSISRPILKAIAAMGFVKPTEIQSRTIPLALQGRDICGSAMTGSGKTAAFIIPILERLLFRPKQFLATRVLILVPTRELGAQCYNVAMGLSKFSTIQVCLCVGGLSNKSQEIELIQKPDIVIATPGRLIDHIHNSKSFSLEHVEILVMDEVI